MTNKIILTISTASIIALVMAPAAFAAPKKNRTHDAGTSVLQPIVNTTTPANIAQAQTSTTTPAPKDDSAPATKPSDATPDASTPSSTASTPLSTTTQKDDTPATPPAINSIPDAGTQVTPVPAKTTTDTPSNTTDNPPVTTTGTTSTDTNASVPPQTPTLAPVTPAFTMPILKAKADKTATTTATSSSPFETVASNIISLIQNGGSDGSGSIYTAGTLSPTGTKNLVALSLAMAALGTLLCFGRVPFEQSVAVARRAYIPRQQARASGSQA